MRMVTKEQIVVLLFVMFQQASSFGAMSPWLPRPPSTDTSLPGGMLPNYLMVNVFE